MLTVRTFAKPAGIPVFPPHDDAAGDCVLRRLLAAEPAQARVDWPAEHAGGLLHRLDTSTSGAVAFARDLEELRVLRDLFARHRLMKSYALRAARAPAWPVNACEAAIAHHPRKRDRMVVQRGAATPHRGRWYPAATWFRRVDGDLLQASMATGVMHQIRVHAAFLGVPLLGDRLYGGGPTPGDAPPGVTFFLHHLGFAGEGDGDLEVVSAPVPTPAWAEAACAS